MYMRIFYELIYRKKLFHYFSCCVIYLW